MDPGRLKKQAAIIDPALDHGTNKALYCDPTTNWLYPDRVIMDLEGHALWQSNGLRLKGPDVEPGRRIAVVWGDSVVFGVCPTWPDIFTSWPETINEFSPDCTFLNGGIEGIQYTDVIKRAIQFNCEHDVVVNIVVLGWHLVGANKNLEAVLRNSLG